VCLVEISVELIQENFMSSDDVMLPSTLQNLTVYLIIYRSYAESTEGDIILEIVHPYQGGSKSNLIKFGSYETCKSALPGLINRIQTDGCTASISYPENEKLFNELVAANFLGANDKKQLEINIKPSCKVVDCITNGMLKIDVEGTLFVTLPRYPEVNPVVVVKNPRFTVNFTIDLQYEEIITRWLNSCEQEMEKIFPSCEIRRSSSSFEIMFDDLTMTYNDVCEKALEMVQKLARKYEKILGFQECQIFIWPGF
jgi:hypothetical protein